jgi:hypothetical protein
MSETYPGYDNWKLAAPEEGKTVDVRVSFRLTEADGSTYDVTLIREMDRDDADDLSNEGAIDAFYDELLKEWEIKEDDKIEVTSII